MDDDVEDMYEYFGPACGPPDPRMVLARHGPGGWEHFSPHDWAWHASAHVMPQDRGVPITAAQAGELAADRHAWVWYLAVFDTAVARPGPDDRPRLILRERYDPEADLLTERFDRSSAAWVAMPPPYGMFADLAWLGDDLQVFTVDAGDALAWLLGTEGDAAFDELGLWTATQGRDDVEFRLVARDTPVDYVEAGVQVERHEHFWRHRRGGWDYFSPDSRRWQPAGTGRTVHRVPQRDGDSVPMLPGTASSTDVVEPVRPAVAATWLADPQRWYAYWTVHRFLTPHDAPPDLVIRRHADPRNQRGTEALFGPSLRRWIPCNYLGRAQITEEDRPVTPRPIDWRTARRLVVELYGSEVGAGFPNPPSPTWHRTRPRWPWR